MPNLDPSYNRCANPKSMVCLGPCVLLVSMFVGAWCFFKVNSMRGTQKVVWADFILYVYSRPGSFEALPALKKKQVNKWCPLSFLQVLTPWFLWLRCVSNGISLNVSRSRLVIHLKRTPTYIWVVGGLVWIQERTPKRHHHVFQRDWITCSKLVNSSRFNSQHNLEERNI